MPYYKVNAFARYVHVDIAIVRLAKWIRLVYLKSHLWIIAGTLIAIKTHKEWKQCP